MNTIQTYLRAHALQLSIAVLICAGLAFGMIDPAAALVGGIVLDTAPLDMKALHEATQKAFEAMKEQNTELKARLLDVEQKLGRRPVGGGSGGDDDNFIMPAFEASEGYKSLLKGETKSVRIAIPVKALQRKATITSTITGGTIGAPDRSGDIIAPAQRRLMIRDLLPSVPTGAGSTEFVRELVYTNAAGPQYTAGSPPVTEGAVKAGSDMTFELVNSPVVTIAHHFTVSRQALEDSAALLQHLETRGIYGWQLELDEELLTATGAAGTLNGLINNAAAFTRGGSGLTGLDVVRKSITQLALGNHVATGCILNPTDAETLELAKDGQGRYMGVVVFVNGQEIVWRVPIIESNTMTAGKFLTGDFVMAARIRERQDAHIEISLDHLDYRTRNLALILIEGRIGLEIHRPNALVYGSL